MMIFRPLAKRAALQLARNMGGGRVAVWEGGAAQTASARAAARVDVVDARAYAAFLRGGVAAAEAYINGWWDSPDLSALMRELAADINAANAIEGGWRALPRRALWALTRARMAVFSRAQARRHVGAHYDLGNDFFALFLDSGMNYSCAIFPPAAVAAGASPPPQALEEAQTRKLEALCKDLDLQENDKLLDLGCGWGALAMHAAATRGCRVTALTLSPRQCGFVRARAAQAGLAGKVRARLADYRDFAAGARGAFDKIASVEMIEAVGTAKFGEYFRVVRQLLKNGGRAAVQAILIPPARYAAAAKEADFINRRIFPGGGLPSEPVVHARAAAAGLRALAGRDIGAHYAPTLAEWRRRFEANLPAVRALGFGEKFCRQWRYYFCYCEGGFAARAIGNKQFLFAAGK